MRLQVVYLGEIGRQLRNRLLGRTHPGANYEPGRMDYLSQLQGSEWTLENFVLGERSENVRHPTVIGLLDGRPSWDLEQIRWRILSELETVVGRWSPGTVTEVGAGTGRNLVWLAHRLGVSCHGVELTEGGAAAGNLAASRLGVDVAMSQGDITDPAVPIPPADVVLSVHALEQIPKPAGVVRRMIEAARKAVIMVEPFPEFWPGGLGQVAHRMRADRLGRLQAGALEGFDFEVERLPFGTALNRASVVTVRT